MDDSHTDAELNRLSREVKNDNKEMHRRRAEGVHKEVTANERKALSLAEQKGSSSWLSTLPVEENCLALHKGAFRDALALKYGWRPTGMPSHRRNGTISIDLLPEISSYDCCQKQAHLSKGDHMDQTKTSFLRTAISAIRATRFLPPPLPDPTMISTLTSGGSGRH